MPDRSERPPGLGITKLGSGGPMAMSDRASPGSVVYIDRVPRIMIDGGGTFSRLGEKKVNDLLRPDTWLFTHLHTDHTSEFPAIIKSMYFLRRGCNVNTPITVVAPTAWSDFPGTSGFVDAFFSPDTGVYRYLHTFLRTTFGKELNLESQDVPWDYEAVREPFEVLRRDGTGSSAIPRSCMDRVRRRHGRLPISSITRASLSPSVETSISAPVV